MWIWLAVLGCAGSAGETDTGEGGDTDVVDTDGGDTDTGPDEEPVIDLRGAWRFAERDLLVDQGDNYDEWLAGQTAADYPEITECIEGLTRVDMGMEVHEDGSLVIVFYVGGLDCDGTGANVSQYEVRRPYGSWSFSHNEGDDRAWYLANGRTWEVYPVSDYLKVREGDRPSMTWYTP